jgi:plasmid stabilization system protein ParE
MSRFRLVREAADDLTEIYDYIAERDNVNAAERVRQELLEAMRLLSQMPGLGALMAGHRRFRSPAAPTPAP